MLFDSFNRQIDYLRVAVTDRCNQRCIYCMPSEGIKLKQHNMILSFEQIEQVVRAATELGIRKVRLTGGEPLVRRDIEVLVGMLSKLPGLDDLCMTTNAILLAELAPKLKRAGLNRVNISINSLNPEKYMRLSHCGNLNAALAGVDAAVEHELTPVKINMIVFEDTTEEEIASMRAFCNAKAVNLQLISHFNLYKRDESPNTFGAERPPKCQDCNRLRLTSDGQLKPCLFSDHEIPVDFSDIRKSLLNAVAEKPSGGTHCRTRLMHEIGG